MNAYKPAVCDPETKMPFLEARRRWKEINVDIKKTSREACSKLNRMFIKSSRNIL
jgi:hypothetical protein